ncbi:hypothetical protein J6590_029129 [Homalodisca vitripennis]|nr:hypothetical protein J6590_029129 [Homalodisca vitripennis]
MVYLHNWFGPANRRFARLEVHLCLSRGCNCGVQLQSLQHYSRLEPPAISSGAADGQDRCAPTMSSVANSALL